MVRRPKKHMRKVVWCNAGALPVKYGLCPGAYAWDKQMKSLGIKDPKPYGGKNRMGAVSCFWHRKTGGLVMLVTLVIDENAHQTWLTFVHEAVHVWQFAMEQMHEEKPGKEVEAYGIETIVGELVSAYQKTLGKNKKSKKWWGRK